MTTIVVDLINRKIGADSQCTMLGTITRCKKIVTLLDGTIIASAGDSVAIDLFVESMENNTVFKLPKHQNINAIVANPDGSVSIYVDDFGPAELPVMQGYYAIGSGSNFAMGAMAAGSDITQALEIAAHFDPYSSGPFDIMKF